MAYYKVRIEVWCDWNPAESDLEDIAQSMGVGEAICTLREVIAVVNRPQDIEDEEAMSFFGGSGTRVRGSPIAKAPERSGARVALGRRWVRSHSEREAQYIRISWILISFRGYPGRCP